MPGKGRGSLGRGKDKGRGGPADGGGRDHGGIGDDAGTITGGRPESPGRSDWSPGHLKKDVGAGSARDNAPGHGGQPPGQVGRNPDDDPRARRDEA